LQNDISQSDRLPLVHELPSHVDVEFAFERLWHLGGCCVLDSAMQYGDLGRYSFLAVLPFETIRIQRAYADPLAGLANLLERFATKSVPGLPPFQGGAAGVFSYEFGRCFERFPAAQHDEFGVPLAVIGLYGTVLSWDHQSKRGWIVSQGFPEVDADKRLRLAETNIRHICNLLSTTSIPRDSADMNVHASAHGLTAPQYETRLGQAWLGNFDSIGFRSAVERAREYIFAGDIFQVNLAQRLMRRATCSSVDLFLNMRQINPAPFAGYFDMGTAEVISASPERFLKACNGVVESRPIKGTRRRQPDSVEHEVALRSELIHSEKDRAENTMIVDLIRNDLSRVCLPDSVRVTQLCELETYPFVLHLVSAVEGQLPPFASAVDLLAATFPGGSITGAPKVRAMEIIAELEPTVRGPYCGSMGYIGFDGTTDLNILIRTVTASHGWWQVQVGGGIVADSRSEAEEEETWTKAAGIVAAIDRSAKKT
jgi:para-aminobenzoate synthetase component I